MVDPSVARNNIQTTICHRAWTRTVRPSREVSESGCARLQPSSAIPCGGATANPWNSRARSGARSSNIFRRAICKLRHRRQNRPILRLNPSSCRIQSTFNPAGAAPNFSDMPTLRPSAFSGLWRATRPDRRHRKLWPADRRFGGIPRGLDGRAGVPLRGYVALAGYAVGFGGAQP
jgi:hypothetical protein